MPKLISIVVPVYNERDNLPRFFEEVGRALAGLRDRYRFELVFTDNHSEDGSFEYLEQVASTNPEITVIRFSRNFGYQKSIWTGLCTARGDAAIQLDADLQDPPALIPRFLELWEQGNMVVYGVRRSRDYEPKPMQWLRMGFYRMINWLSEDYLPLDAGDFRLVDRTILEQLKKMEDQQPYLRGLIASIGYRQVGVPYDRSERTAGSTKFELGDLVKLAMDGVLNHSIVPLRIATFTGIVVAAITILASIVFLIGRIVYGESWPAGFATTAILILMSISLNVLFLGIIGEYLGRIYQQVKRRPMVIIERSIQAKRPE